MNCKRSKEVLIEIKVCCIVSSTTTKQLTEHNGFTPIYQVIHVLERRVVKHLFDLRFLHLAVRIEEETQGAEEVA